MYEKEKISDRIDYLDGLPKDFIDFIYETKIINENKKHEKLSSKSNNSDESNDSIERKITKLFEKKSEIILTNINDHENFSKERSSKNTSFEKLKVFEHKNILINKFDLKSKIKKDKKNNNKKKNFIDEEEFSNYNDEFYDNLYDEVQNDEIELNPKYEEAEYYDNYISDDQSEINKINSYDEDINEEEDYENLNQIKTENFFMNKNNYDKYKDRRDLI